jgi:predicted nucleic-acid-binding Zn-ribbon protein|tara:strand:+ start:53 stop:271 length:219 start_codon:yes stop_codon:yes gene_type:complete
MKCKHCSKETSQDIWEVLYKTDRSEGTICPKCGATHYKQRIIKRIYDSPYSRKIVKTNDFRHIWTYKGHLIS